MTVHRLEDFIIRVLERQVYIMEHLGLGSHGVDKLVGYLIGIAIEQAYPLDAVDFAEQIQQMGESVFAVEINAVGRDILRDKHELFDAPIRKGLRLFDYTLLVAAAERSADGRDGAIGAAVRASLGYLEIRPVIGSSEHALTAHGELFFVGENIGLLAVENFVDYLVDIAVCADADDRINLGNLLKYLVAVALGEASGDNDRADESVFFEADHLQNCVDSLLLGGVDKRAGVDYNCVEALEIVRIFKSGVLKLCKHQLTVDLILRAAERHE